MWDVYTFNGTTEGLKKRLNRHAFVLEGEKLSERDKEDFLRFRDRKPEPDEYKGSLKFLCECIKKATGKNTIILLDEYDVPLESTINYVDDHVAKHDAFPVSYWANTSSNSIVRDLIERADPDTKGDIVKKADRSALFETMKNGDAEGFEKESNKLLDKAAEEAIKQIDFCLKNSEIV